MEPATLHTYSASKAFQMKSSSQRPNKLTSQTFATLLTYPRGFFLGFPGLVLLLLLWRQMRLRLWLGLELLRRIAVLCLRVPAGSFGLGQVLVATVVMVRSAVS